MSKKANNYKVIDMHCDTVLRLMYSNEPLLKTEGHLDLERMKKGNYALQCFAMFVHYKKVERPFEYVNKMIDKYYAPLLFLLIHINHLFATKNKIFIVSIAKTIAKIAHLCYNVSWFHMQ